MEGHQQGRGGHHDELEGPEANLGDGEEVVEAGVFTAGLLGVADKFFLLILPHLLGRCDVHQDAEDEEDGEPNSPDDSGVLVHPAQDTLQKAPVHFPVVSTLLFREEGHTDSTGKM
uniref:Uncharacterized protein n=1 Tax=Myripristis murdjan TaxID=586833 RepID=A0A667ZGJ6_9TELE